MTSTVRTFTGVIVMLLMAGQAFAQLPETVTENEFDRFAKAFKEIQTISQESQTKMIEVVEDHGLQVDRFNEIITAEQNPTQDLETSEEEMGQFNAAIEEINKIQEKSQQDMETNITDNKLTVERYLEINDVLQTDPELQQKLMEKIQD